MESPCEHDEARPKSGMSTAHVDTFCRDMLPPESLWPQMTYGELPELSYPSRLNCAVELLDGGVAEGVGDRPLFHSDNSCWTYAHTLEVANRISHVLVDDLELVPGNRVLLRGPNSPMLAACWLAVLKAGGVAVCTSPMLRVRELISIIKKAQINLCLIDERSAADCELAMATAAGSDSSPVRRALHFNSRGAGSLEERIARKPVAFANVNTMADDVAIIAFTSGSTGEGKGTMHFHRDLLAVTDTFARYILRPTPDEIFCGTPPLAFTYALGGLLLFPMRFGASVVLTEHTSPKYLLDAIQRYRATTCFTAPTGYRAMLDMLSSYDISSLRKCVSAGEFLSFNTFEAWRTATGLKIVDGIGSTEMLHMFISSPEDQVRPGSTGRVVPGYFAKVIADNGEEVPTGTVGRLAVRGPTGCRYLGDPARQREYVQQGWNLTGDLYSRDEDGYFWYQSRADDMIISSGYNIAGPEVESVLLDHPKVAECAVIGVPDTNRGQIVKAFVVLRPNVAAGEDVIVELQNFVKSQIAPYKYPRAIEFTDCLPKTVTGKIQRYRLRSGD